MKLKDIQAKIAKNEELTEAEKKFLAEYDSEKAVNEAAAAARRKAEEKQAEAEKALTDATKKLEELTKQVEAKENEGKTDLEKAQGQIAALGKKVEELTGQLTDSTKAQTELQRSQTIADLRRKAGIQFVDGLDHDMLGRSFGNAFEGIEDLTNEEVTKPIVETWRAMNKAAILDGTGHGTGDEPRAPGSPDVSAMTLDGQDVLQTAINGDIEEAEALLDKAEAADAAGKLEVK